MNLSKFEKYNLSAKDLIQHLQYLDTLEDLNNFAKMYNIEDINDLEVLRRAWEFVKEKVVRPVGTTIGKAFAPIQEAIKGRTQHEIEMAGRRIAQQIYPQGQFLPIQQPQQPQQPQQIDLNKIIPYLGIALLVLLLLRKQK
ncbi:MAG: hypothetical protein RMJ67_06375 [Elusimicrobiota bacterium]|nr:hypothetical protein [Endomicrobiia bacterium]MDW8166119.1 hypothetical protein [Elusimicrobiota bacterium]